MADLNSDSWLDPHNNYQPGAYNVNSDEYEYGGQKGGAAAAMQRQQQMGEAAQNRGGVQMDTSQMNQSRGQQQGAMGLQYAAATGQAPSVAAIQQRQGMEAAQAAQASAAASARGGGANLAAAQRMGATQGAQLAAQNTNSAAALRAGEMAQARDAYANSTSSARGQDYQSSMGQAQLSDAQRARNDAFQMNMEGGANQTGQAQLNAQGNLGKQQSDNYNSNADREAGVAAQNAATNKGILGGLAGGASSVIGDIGDIFSDEKLKTGIQPIESPSAPVDSVESVYGPDRSVDSADNVYGYKSKSDGISGGDLAKGIGAGLGGASAPSAPTVPKGLTPQQVARGDVVQSRFTNPTWGDPSRTETAQATANPGKVENAIVKDSFNPMAETNRAQGKAMGNGPMSLGRFTSDKRDKTDIHSDEPEMKRALGELHPYEYQYKDQARDGEGRRVGIIAQDLLKTKAGAPVVEKTPHGLALDDNKAISFNLAAVADLDKRLRNLEYGRGR